MTRTGSFPRYWLPVLLWMALIFCASADTRSAQRSSRILGPVLRWLKPDLSEQTLQRTVFLVRKTAHTAEYAVLAVLLWRARRRPVKADPRPWNRAEAAFALGVSALYAASDELHQAFVPNRQAHLADVLLDTAGAALGLLVLWAFFRWRKGWSRPAR